MTIIFSAVLIDPVTGKLRQVTVSQGIRPRVQVDGETIPHDHPFRYEVLALLESFADHYADLDS